MSITFGSVGDIIAVRQIAWSLAKALNDSRGSAKEYQGLVKDLQAFQRAVLNVCLNMFVDWVEKIREKQK
jgi:hypothetical protein